MLIRIQLNTKNLQPNNNGLCCYSVTQGWYSQSVLRQCYISLLQTVGILAKTSLQAVE